MATILVVEDDWMNREMLQRRLRWEGYEVLVAVNGTECIDMARLHRPSLILMDMGLPIVDGWEAASVLKADLATAAIPIIALTAYALLDDRRRSLETGCDDYEPKPVDFRRLLHKITMYVTEQLRSNEVG